MTNPSPHPNSYSPKDRKVFQWPVPLSPGGNQDSHSLTSIPWREMMDKYNDDTDTLRHILNAKAEEDKRQAASDLLKVEEARIRLKRMEMDYLHEQYRLGVLPRYPDCRGYGYATAPATGPPPSATPSTYMQNLTPVQQQMIARITGQYPDGYSSQQDHPASPSHPQTAHPLCPPSEPRKGHQLHRLQIPNTMQPTTPVSPAVNGNVVHQEEAGSNNSSGSSGGRAIKRAYEQPDEKPLSHNKVMEALKAKLQRGSPIGTTPSSSLPTHPSHSSSANHYHTHSQPSHHHPPRLTDSLHADKRQRQLPKPVSVIDLPPSSTGTNGNGTPSSHHQHHRSHHQHHRQHHSPSPRSAKPLLPPIDTNVGRHQQAHSPLPSRQKDDQDVAYSHRSSSTPPASSTQHHASPSDYVLAINASRNDED